MYELVILAVVVAVILLSIRSGKTVRLDDPIIIHHPGQCHITLAPQLEQAGALVEQIARQFRESHIPQGDIPTQYLEVSPRQDNAQKQACYLLAIAWRRDMLYFQAIGLDSFGPGDYLKKLREFSEAVLVLLPCAGPTDTLGEKHLRDIVKTVASQSGGSVRALA